MKDLITPQQLEQYINLAVEGKRQSEITKILGITIYRYNIMLHDKEAQEEIERRRIDKIISLYTQGYLVNDIAKVIKKSKTYLTEVFDKYNIRKGKPYERRKRITTPPPNVTWAERNRKVKQMIADTRKYRLTLNDQEQRIYRALSK